MVKYRFEVNFQTSKLKQVSDFLNKFDLKTGNIVLKEVITFDYTSEQKPISYFKDLICQAYESIECSIFKIEGGMIK